MNETPDIQVLISRYFNGSGSLGASEATELCAWVKQDVANAREFAVAAFVHRRLRDLLHSARALRAEEFRGSLAVDPGVVARKGSSPTAVGAKERSHRGIGRYAVATLLLLCLIIGVTWRWMSAPMTATVIAGVSAHWDSGATEIGSSLPENEKLILKSGVVELKAADGASMVVEAPCQLTVLSADRVRLDGGRISAVVPPSAHGFTIQTPTATVTDLGTEFGVSVGTDGATEVMVFKGRVRAAPGNSESSGSFAAQVLVEGQRARVSSAGVAIDPVGARAQAFVRSLSTSAAALDVVDLVAGGDGTTGRRGMGINVRTGDAGALPQLADYSGDAQYHRVTAVPVVDGCFLPDGRRGPTQIDSSGHTFVFPLTSNQSAHLLYAGGSIPAPPSKMRMLPTLGGVDYSKPPHGLLAMHPNKGLTIDLAAIRRLYPGRSLSRFRCVAGNTIDRRSESRADLFVLVDASARFEKRGFVVADGPFPVLVPLQETDRFLTLATTDGGDGIAIDWVLLGDPVIELKAKP